MSQKVHIYLVRHGESIANAEKRMQGRVDSPLSEVGIKQAVSLANALNSIKFKGIFTSPLKRAYHTAEIIAEHREIPIIIDPELIERDIGIFSNLTISEASEKFPHFFSEYLKGGFNKVPLAETDQDLQTRVNRVLQRLNQLSEGYYLIVSHGIFISSLLSKEYNISEKLIKLKNAEFNIIEFYCKKGLNSINVLSEGE